MKFCPHCGGDLVPYLAATAPASGRPTPTPTAAYNQTEVWRELVATARARRAEPAPAHATLVDAALDEFLSAADPTKNVNGIDSIVHLVFDQSIVPRGGVLMSAIAGNGQTSMDAQQLELLGYLVTNGKAALVDGQPVSRAYGALEYWGGEKQYKRWHLAKPAAIEPSRNGNPFFMDEEMLAFGATWRDIAKIRDALMDLLSSFATGVRGEKTIATPLVLKIIQRT